MKIQVLKASPTFKILTGLALLLGVGCSSGVKNTESSDKIYPFAQRNTAQRSTASTPPSVTLERMPILNYEYGGLSLVQTVENRTQYIFETCIVDFKVINTGEKLMNYLNSALAQCQPLTQDLLPVSDEALSAALDKRFSELANERLNSVRPQVQANKKYQLFVAAILTAVPTAVWTTAVVMKNSVAANSALALAGMSLTGYLAYRAQTDFMSNPPITLEVSLQKTMQKPEYKSLAQDLQPAVVWDIVRSSLKRAAEEAFTAKFKS